MPNAILKIELEVNSFQYVFLVSAVCADIRVQKKMKEINDDDAADDDVVGDDGDHCTQRWKKSLLVTHTKWLRLGRHFRSLDAMHTQDRTTTMLQFHLFCALTRSPQQRSRANDQQKKKNNLRSSMCVEWRTGPATSWSVKLWVTIYHLLGLTWFTSIKDKNGCGDAVRVECTRNGCRLEGYSAEDSPSSSARKEKKEKRITEINWIFDLSWHKFDVNEIGHFTCAFLRAAVVVAATNVTVADCTKKCQSTHWTVDACTALVSIDYICDDIVDGSTNLRRRKKNWRKKNKFNFII